MTSSASPDSARKPVAVDVHVGHRIRLRRMMLGMTQDKLAKACGISFQQMQKYERGINRVGSGRLQQVATFLSVSPSFFFEDLPNSGSAGNGARTPALNEFLGTVEGIKLVTAFMNITDAKMRRAILSIVQGASTQERRNRTR